MNQDSLHNSTLYAEAASHARFEAFNALSPKVMQILEVDVDAITYNYQFLKSKLNPGSQCSAVVKADAYGLGVREIAMALGKVGCQHFFIATIEEGMELRALLPEAQIYVFNGLLSGTEAYFTQNQLVPVLNDLMQVDLWRAHAKTLGQKLPTVIHFDTGMHRLGLSESETELLLRDQDRFLEGLDLKFIMSHLACSDILDHPQNEVQRGRFNEIRKHLPSCPASLANSRGIFLGGDYHYDLVRPGQGLYGLGLLEPSMIGARRAVRSFAKILQVRDIKEGESIGYGATFQTKASMRLATLAIGYADGCLRSLTNAGTVYIGGFQAPIVGRVSMDLATVDVTEIPEVLAYPGAWVEFIGDHISTDEVAALGGTISREIVTRLGRRYHRIYRKAQC